MEEDSYLGILDVTESEYRKMGSKFLGFLHPVNDLTQFEILQAEYKERFADASHVCYGLVLEPERSFQKFSDDGEPSNSAGRPILNAVLSSGISNAACFVIRYFGGKKLGIPGLIGAYGQAAIDCIEAASITTLFKKQKIVCTINPAKQHVLFNFLNKQKNVEYEFTDGQFNITCLQSMTAPLRSKLSKINTLVLK